jgi:WD40 repeat protein
MLATWAALSAAQVPTEKTAVPDKAAQTAAEAVVKRILGDEFTRPGADAAATEKMIQTLRQHAADTKEVALRFVLLREARDLAARTGDVGTALRVASELAEEYAVDEPGMCVAVLRLAAPAAKTPRAKRALAQAALDLLGRFLDADDPDAALALAATAEAAAAEAGDVLRAEVEARVREARLIQKERARVKEFAERLKKAPADVEANLEVGKYHALRGDWARSLPLLARGPDGDFKTVARRDLDAPTDAREQVKLAEDWRRLVKGEPDLLSTNMLLRAGYWYQQALLRLDGDERIQAEAKLLAVAEALPAGRRLPGYFVLLRRFEGHQGNVTGVAFAHDGRRVLTASADRTLRLWDAATGKQRKRIAAHDSWVRCVAFAPDDRRAISCGDDNLLRLWEVASGREVRRFKGHTEWVRCAAFLPDPRRGGGRLVSGSDDGTLRLWDVETGKELKRFTGHKGYVMSLAVSGDGRRLLSGGADESVRLWDVEDGKELRRFDGHRGSVNAVALSPDGRKALSGGADGTVRLWDTRSRELRSFPGHKGSVWSVAFAPDGRLALSGGADRTARLWDVSSGREVCRLLGHSALVLSVAFSPDGHEVVTGSADKTARLWGPPSGRTP